MELLREINERFTTGFIDKSWSINNIDSRYPAIIISGNGYYGVAVENKCNKEINEEFASAKIYNETLIINGVPKKYILFISSNIDTKKEFATICTNFVDPGKNGELREFLLANPIKWWENWKELLGNVDANKKPYSVIAELMVLRKIFEFDKTITWGCKKDNIHDLEADAHNYEVKSTIQKYSEIISITSENQLESDYPLNLFLCRMEQTSNGSSIDDMVNYLKSDGYDEGELEKKLFALKYKKGSMARKIKYTCFEMREYNVDNNFPKLTNASFIGGVKPMYIKEISYKISLEGIKFRKII